MSSPVGSETSRFFRLFWRAPTMRISSPASSTEGVPCTRAEERSFMGANSHSRHHPAGPRQKNFHLGHAVDNSGGALDAFGGYPQIGTALSDLNTWNA